MPSRRKRYSSVIEVEASVSAVQSKATEIRHPGAFGTATNAPFGFSVQGSLACEDIAATGNVSVTTTTGAVLLPRLTTTQRNALTAANGMIVYNTTASKFQGYAGGSWVNLH
jgi:hypothetical protein